MGQTVPLPLTIVDTIMSAKTLTMITIATTSNLSNGWFRMIINTHRLRPRQPQSQGR